MTRLIPALAVLVCVAACSKNNSSKPSLTGKWKQIEYFNSTGAGACNCWVAVNDMVAEKIEFRSDGTYQRTASMISSLMYCPGTYKVISDSIVTMHTDCTGAPLDYESLFSKEGNTLTITYIPVQTGPGLNWASKIKYKKE